MRDEFGFGNKRNLALAAFLGLVYTIAAWQAGNSPSAKAILTHSNSASV